MTLGIAPDNGAAPVATRWTPERARRAMRALAEIGRVLSESEQPERIASQIASTLPALLAAARVAVYRLEPESGELVDLAGGSPLAAMAARLVARERHTLLTPDLVLDPLSTPPDGTDAPGRGEPRAVLAIPLITRDRVVGALAVSDRAGRVFGAEEMRVAHAFAEQAALALEDARLRASVTAHARLWNEAEQRRREAEIEAELLRDINASLELPAVLQRVADAARELTASDTAMIALRDPASQAMVVRYRAGARLNAYADRRVEAGQGVSGQVLQTGRPFRTDNCATDPRVAGPGATIATEDGSGSAVAVPITIGDRVIGVLGAHHRLPRAFSERAEAVLGRLAAQAAVATENARLFAGEQGGRLAAEASALALRESEERFRQLVDIFFVLDSAGRFVEVNARACASLGYAREELLARSVADVEADFIPGRIADLWTRLTPGVPITIDTVHRRKDGTTFPVELRMGLFESGGRRLLFALGRDVTERRALEEQVRRAQKMEGIGRVAGGVVHDFNNLLTVISGRSQILLRQLGHDDGARRDLALIYETAKRAAALTRQFLTLGRKQAVEPTTLDLNDVVAGMETLLRRLLGEDIELVLAVAPALGRVRADAGQIEQVVMNLAVNARDAMTAGGRLTIETANVDLPDTPDRRRQGLIAGACVALVVRDSGSGMDSETRSRIFEPFFTTKGPEGGTGLGLATVYAIVKQSGGEIRVESEPGRGATFSVYLPRVDSAAEIVPAAELPAAAPGSETILVVEDEREVRELAKEILEAASYTVLDAGGPDEALRIAREHPRAIHLLVTDVVMPRMRGQELVERVTASRPQMKVLYMSGHVARFHGATVADAAFLQKPFTPDDLTRKVREVLDAG